MYCCWKRNKAAETRMLKKNYTYLVREKKNGGKSLRNCSISNRNLLGGRSLKHSVRTARDTRVRKIRIRIAKSDRR